MNANTIDMLVKLYDLAPLAPELDVLSRENIIVRRARVYEKHQILDWVESNFSRGWASECSAGFASHPVNIFIATYKGKLIGFACVECTYKNYFGPIGVLSDWQGKKLGRALLLSSLYGMKELGYAYAIIGGPTTAVDFYKKAVGAVVIEGSTPGIYIDRLTGADS